MKLAFFLFSLIVASHQQFQQPGGMIWKSPQRTFYYYYYYPLNHGDIEGENPSPFLHYVRAASPNLITQVDQPVAEFPDAQSRMKGVNMYQPSFASQQPDARFFFGTATTFTNPFLKTATFTLTSTINLTSVVSCIVEGDFLDAAAQVAKCRRKRDILDALGSPEDLQFPITPSGVEQLMPTALPENGQMSADVRDITSSQGDVDDNSNLRSKRFFFNYYVASTTLTSYIFFSSVVTKTVDLGIDNGLNCLPSGYVVC